jgi:hypothetical protein
MISVTQQPEQCGMSEIDALLKTAEATLAKAAADQRRPLSIAIEQTRGFAQIYRDVPAAMEDLAASLRFQIETATA